MSGSQLDPDVKCDVFLLEPDAEEAETKAG